TCLTHNILMTEDTGAEPTFGHVETNALPVPALDAIELPVGGIAEGAGTAAVLTRELHVGHTWDARIAGESDDVGCESADRQVARRMDPVERHLVAALEVHAFGDDRGEVERLNVDELPSRRRQIQRGAVRQYRRHGILTEIYLLLSRQRR